ncbi:MAG: glycine cleavage system protein GcvH [Planctomycetota bacterium]
MPIPNDRRYLDTHEWHLADGDVCTIGITQHAADELTDVTYVDLPEAGSEVVAGEAFGEVESVKATADLVSGVSGEVVEVNEDIVGDPSLVNSDPHEGGWMIKVRMTDATQLDVLLDAEGYATQTGAEE